MTTKPRIPTAAARASASSGPLGKYCGSRWQCVSTSRVVPGSGMPYRTSVSLSEEQFRALLDPCGVVRPGALEAPDRSGAYTVFAQRPDAALDIDALRAHALRFFGVKL